MEEPLEEKSEAAAPAIPPERLEEIKGLLLGSQKPASGSDAISSILNNPEFLSRLPQMMETLKPLLGNLTQKPTVEAKPLSREEERDRLLLSLRPFLSKERQNLVESILKLSKLGEALKYLS